MCELGVVLRDEVFAGGVGHLRDALADLELAGADFVGVLDHLSFWDGTGFDGLVNATAVLAAHPTIRVRTAVYLLPLRHPIAVARQLSSMRVLAPGRFAFGVGVGGEDRAEVAAAGVAPSTRGRRMDASLSVLRQLQATRRCTQRDAFFTLEGVEVKPGPDPAMPILIGGRSDAALTRAARFGDGWIGFAVSPARFARAVARVEEQAAASRRDAAGHGHGLVVWCGFDDDREQARRALAAEMESLYKLPFERFARYTAWGSPEHVAERLMEYADAGCRSFSVIPVTPRGGPVAHSVAELRRHLDRGAPLRPAPLSPTGTVGRAAT